MAVPHDQAREVLQATDIVDVIGEQIRLEKKGKEFVGLCPFHDDRNPSMSVVPSKQIFHCFVCNTGGDAIRFVREYHKMAFREALHFLADRAGVQLAPHASGRIDSTKGLRESMEWALRFFRGQYANEVAGLEARRYVDGRAIDDATAEAFQLGYAPDGWDALVKAATVKGLDLKQLETAGVIAARPQAGGHYDRMRHRLVFPICDRMGLPIAFGGRRLRESDDPKYLNTPESPLFDKSRTLYGLHLARKAILAERQAVVVEGYTDVIACHQAGIQNVVGTLGTALTAEHVKQLRHFAQRVVLLFDPDDAGRRAADRATELFLEGELDVAIALLPDNLDPADLLARPDGASRWAQAMAAATEALEYQFQEMRQRLAAEDSVAGRQQVTEEYLRRLATLGLERQDPVRRAFIYRKVAYLLHLREEEIAQMIRGYRPPRRQGDRGASESAPRPTTESAPNSQLSVDQSVALDATAPRIPALQMAERHLIGALLRKPGWIQLSLEEGKVLGDAVTPKRMVSPIAARLYEQFYPRLQEGQSVLLNDLILELSEQGHDDLVNVLTGIDSEMEQRCGEDEEKLLEHLRGAAKGICRFHEDRAYDQKKKSMAATRTDSELRSLVEQQAASPRPSSIGRSR